MNHLYIALFIFILSAEGCQTPPPDALAPPGSRSLQETDSTIVSSLIRQSENHYISHMLSEAAFDDYLKQAEEIALKNDFKQQLALIYNSVGIRYRNLSDYTQALHYARKATQLAREINNPVLLAESTNMLAVIYRRIDENKHALDLHMEAMQIAESIQDTFQKNVALNGLGNVYLNLKRYHASIEYFRKSYNIAKERGNILGLAINANNIGESLKELGQTDSALIYFNRSLDYNTQIGSSVGKAICYNSLGDIYRIKKQYSLAIKYLNQALIHNIQSSDKINISASYSILGETYMEIKDYSNAIAHLTKGLNIAEEIGSKYQIEVCSRLLSKTYETTHDLKSALHYLKLASQYKDSILNEENLRHLATTEAIHEINSSKNQISILNNETTLQKELISQQKKTIISVMITCVLLLIVGTSMVWHVKLRSQYNNIVMQQRLLRTQMNPHFIFNALSAIQVYILENDMKKSSSFLANFASLMRQVLRSSQYEYVTIAEEVKMLGYYLELQRLRFIEPFSFEIETDHKLDENYVLIPPMITQPFIENAIEHGIKTRGENGQILVRFFNHNERLGIEIEDNGIGWKAAKENGNMDKNHESMAMKITHERLEVIKKVTKKKTHLEIIDLQERIPGKNGVLVRMEIPIINLSHKIKKNKNRHN